MITTDNRPKQRDREGRPLKGIEKTRLHEIWKGMHTRCYNQNFKYYHRYGGRGITVCDEWNQDNLQGYYNFREWSLANGYEEGKSIDRIDNNKGYEPLNCRWTTDKEQMRNRNCNQPITVDGKEYRTLSEAVEALNRTEDGWTIRTRIKHGYTPDRAFSEPIAEHCKPIIYDGVQYNSIAECCRALNLNPSTVLSYRRRYNTTTEEAIQHYSIK